MKDFFISYSWEDKAIVRPLAERLIAKGFSVWIDDRNLPAGKLPPEILRAIEQCQALLLMWSQSSYISEWVNDEWHAAIENNKPIVPCLLDDIPIPNKLKEFFYIDLRSSDDGISLLIQTLQNQLGKRSASIITETGSTAAQQRGQSSRIQNLPYRENPNFTGREQYLDDIRKSLIETKAAAITQSISISGLGGVGKTQLATHYAYSYQDDYDVIWWLRAEGPLTLTASISALARALDLPEKNEPEQEIITQAVMKWLKQNLPWLLIFDNAQQPEVVLPFLPVNPNGHVLITSRNPDWQPVISASTIALDTWQRPESIKFLLKRTGQDHEESANAVADILGDLPLALEQAGAYIKATGSSYAEYLELFRHASQKLLDRKKPIDYDETVATTWEVAFRRIDKQQPEAIELLRLCAFLAPEEISRKLIYEGLTQGRGQSRLADPLVFQDAIAALTEYSLLEAEAGSDMLSVHRLVQVITRNRLPPETYKDCAEVAVELVRRAFPSEDKPPDDIRFWPACEALLAHGLSATAHADKHGHALIEVATLMNQMGLYLNSRAMYSTAESLYRRALEIREEKLGHEHPDVAQSLYNLALLLMDEGHYAASESLFRRALGIREKKLGPEHADVAESLNGLTILLQARGNYAAAEPLSRRALEILEKQLGKDHPQVATVLNNLALFLQDQGKYASAEPLFRRALEIREEKKGPDHPDVAQSLNNLAGLFLAQGQHTAAEPLYRRAIEIGEKTLGIDHPDVATRLNNLAELLRAQGNYDAAEPLYRRTLDILEKRLGLDHPWVATCLNNLAKLLQDKGQYAVAEPLFRRAIDILEKKLGVNHPNTKKGKQNYQALLDKMQSKS